MQEWIEEWMEAAMTAQFVEYFGPFFSSFIAMIVIIDPFGVAPIYLSLTERYSVEQRKKIRNKSILIATGILLTVCLTGLSVFKFFGITIPAFQIAGGILLLLMGIQQLNANHPTINKEEQSEGLERNDISVFPLAIPLLAGPGAISTIVIYASNDPTWTRLVTLSLGVITAMAVSWLALKYAPILFRVLGQTGLNLLTRLIGIVLTAVAVQFILDGLTAALAKSRIP